MLKIKEWLKSHVISILLVTYLAGITPSYKVIRSTFIDAHNTSSKKYEWTYSDRLGCVVLSAIWPISLPVHTATYLAKTVDLHQAVPNDAGW